MLIYPKELFKYPRNIMSVFIFVMFLLILNNIHPFLAKDDPIQGEILVFEGWVYNKDNAVSEALSEFERGNYKMIVTVGLESDNNNDDNSTGQNYAESAKNAFILKGISEQKIVGVSAPDVQKQKTFSMALAFKMWLLKSGFNIKKVNVFTFGVHARKSEVVFKQVLEPGIKVGVIAAKPTHYNPKYWWITKTGWKWVIYDLAKYIRARLC